MSTSTLWLGDETFQARLTEYLVEPVLRADRFEEEAMPVRPMVAVYGHHESDKAAVVLRFCNEHSLCARVVSFRFGATGEAVREIQRALLETQGSLAVLILDHADVLILEPDDRDSQLAALNLRTLALEHSILLVGCFDRVLNARETDSYARNCIRPWMHAICYLAPPTSPWIATWLLAQLQGYVTRHGPTEGFQLELTADEATVVAQHCVGASYGHLVAWIRRIWYHAYQSGTRHITKEWLLSPPLMSMRSGRLHILDEDVRADESKFSIAAGQGPVGPPAHAPQTSSAPRLMTPMPEDQEAK